MHISLDSALGRQRRLNSVGESVFQIAPNAAAGYSLRSLTGGDPAVVRVRRESDNAERDFNASGVSSGELVNWVNQQITPPLDLRELTATGRDGPIIDAAAAYSLRNLSDSYTGNVVEVRRNTDGALKDFKASEVTDGTLEAWVNTSFANALPLDTASGAAAAYSLRNLSTGYTGNVVDVRRSSDDAEDSFTAAEVADGTMVAWVNTDVDKLDLQAGSLDAFITNETATGFDFSVNNVGSNKFKNLLSAADTTAGTYTATLDVVLNSGSLTGCNLFHESSGSAVVTPLTEGANSISLTPDANTSLFFYILGTAVADVSITNITLTQTSADGTVSQWYDQSGNDNHATQGTDASQPKIVSAGSLLNEIKFDGADDVLNFTEIDFSTNSWMLSAVVDWDGSVSPIVGGSTTQWSLQVATSDNFSSRATNDSTIHNFDPTSSIATGDGLFTVQRSSDVLSGYYDGVLDDAAPAITAASEFKADKIGQRGSLYGSSGVKEIIIYETDQSDKRIAIEENIGSNYGITVTSSKDGTVSTWYDQSTTAGTPNANHAVQATPASQPKIVDAGSLVTGGLDFDGTDDFFDITPISTSSTALSTFIFGDAQPSVFSYPIGNNNNAGIGVSSTQFRYNLISGTPILEDWPSTLSGQNLYTFIHDGTTGIPNTSGYRNGAIGSQTSATQGAAPSDFIRYIGTRNQVQDFVGVIGELIIYNSDQTDNRTALEANIGEVYSIAGIPAYDDTVNGFVESWYDQSGNGNDAVQETAGNQPKIVDGGVLVSGGIDFNGAQELGKSSPSGFSGKEQSYFVKFTPTSTIGYVVELEGGIGAARSLSVEPYLRFNVATQDYDSTILSGDSLLSMVCPNTPTTIDGYDLYYQGSLLTPDSLSGGVLAGVTSGAINIGSGIYVGRISEVIVYNSDQSANRAAIETNINNQYDIY